MGREMMMGKWIGMGRNKSLEAISGFIRRMNKEKEAIKKHIQYLQTNMTHCDNEIRAIVAQKDKLKVAESTGIELIAWIDSIPGVKKGN